MVVVETILESMWRCFGEPYPTSNSGNGLTEAETLALARKEAQQKNSQKLISSSSLDRSRNRSNKRKADIFRTKPSVEDDRPRKPMPYHGFLCFANPIQSEEGNAQVEDQDGDETVASTIYFDAKYEHIIQTKPPMPLYMEYSVPVSEERNNEIAQIVENGTHKSIHMFMDGENIQSKWYEQNVCKTLSQEESDSTASSATHDQKPQGETNLEVLSNWGQFEGKKKGGSYDTSDPPGLRLLTNSSVSTAAMTDLSVSKSMISIRRQNSTNV